MRGLLIYNHQDYCKNSDYVRWLTSYASTLNLDINLYFSEDFFKIGLPDQHFDFIINRSRSYDLSLILELNNYLVFNNSHITLIGNNKLAAYKYAYSKKIEFAPVLCNWKHKEEIISKPICDHGGNGIYKYVGEYPEFNSNLLQQEFINNLEGDIRFYIIGNKIINSIIRRPKNGFISNYSKGGSIELYKYSKEQEKIVLNFISDLSIDFAGIDFILLKNGDMLFNEVEDVVGSRMLSELKINNTTELFMNHIQSKLKVS